MENNTANQRRLCSFVENIAHISNVEYQKRVWVKNEGPECEDIDDAVCDFFDDGDPILENYKDFGITETQYKVLMTLRRKLDNFIDEYGVFAPEESTERLIELPQWQEIREISKRVLKDFNFKKR